MRLNERYVEKKDYIKILELFSEYDYKNDYREQEDFFKYKTQDLQLTKLKKKYDYCDYLVSGKEFRTMVNLMKWVSDKLIGNGACIPPTKLDADYILSKTVEEKMESNCFMYALVLNEIFLSMGYFSRMVRCMPMDLNFQDCHCMTEVYSKEYRKWVAFDAANQAYYIDATMQPLNIFEIRQNLMKDQKMYIPMMSRKKTHELFEYLIKNMVRFECYQISQAKGENKKGVKKVIHFQASNFPICDKKVKFSEEDIVIEHCHISNPKLFWQEPKLNSESRKEQ